MKRLNFLFLGGAKRVVMGRMLLQACKERGIEATVNGYELTRQVPLAEVGHIEEGLRWSDPAIFDDINRVVDNLDINVIIPFVDPAVGIAAEVGRRSEGVVFVPCGDRTTCERMFDKVLAAELFERCNLPIPPTYRPGDSVGCLIAKPRFGSASNGIKAIDTIQQLYEVQSKGDRYLIQKRIDHREEITVDCYASVSTGEVYACSPRTRLEVSGGEAVRTITIDDSEAISLARRTIAAAKLCGAITVQLIRNLDDNSLMVMEVNPRLGGGAVCSVHAGADIPGLIVDEALGRPLSESVAKPGVLTVRYLADVVFNV